MPIAAGKIDAFCRFLAASGTPSSVMAATGKRQPMMPVELGRTASCGRGGMEEEEEEKKDLGLGHNVQTGIGHVYRLKIGLGVQQGLGPWMPGLASWPPPRKWLRCRLVGRRMDVKKRTTGYIETNRYSVQVQYCG